MDDQLNWRVVITVIRKNKSWVTHLIPSMLLAMVLFIPCSLASDYTLSGSFIVKPYLQIGNTPLSTNPETLILMWHARDLDLPWSVEIRTVGGDDWLPVEQVSWKRIAVPTIEPHRVYRALLKPLEPGMKFEYRVLEGNQPVFSATGQARKPPGQPCRVIVFADVASGGNRAQRALAYQIFRQKPDLIVIPGDIVYEFGRIAEYRKYFFPIYNADTASPEVGAPMMRSIPFIAGLGAHDVQENILYEEVPDGFAYYMYWTLPMNGPDLKFGDHNTLNFRGGIQQRQSLIEAIQPGYPRMATYSLDYGNTHWSIIDTNDYVDWKDPVMRDWLSKDLKNTNDSNWKFIGCYAPGFQSGRSHLNMQKMRIAADIFEKGGADIVFHGCNHDYERTMPLKFRPTRISESKIKMTYQAVVEGEYILDKTFDGRTQTKPDGVIYITTGVGGASLQNPEQTGRPETWQPFCAQFIGDQFSFTLLDITDTRLIMRQISETGKELDRIIIDR